MNKCKGCVWCEQCGLTELDVECDDFTPLDDIEGENYYLETLRENTSEYLRFASTYD